MLIINSEHAYSEDNFETNLQARIYPYNQSFEKQEEELIEFNEEHHDELIKSSSVPIQHELLTLNSEHPSSEDHSKICFQDKIYPSDKSFEKQEE